MGKTSVLHMFSKLGAHTFDADSFVHDILTKPNIIRRIEKILGINIKTNGSSKLSIDKKRVADIIFADSDKRKAVENVIHPLVLKAMEKTESRILKKDRSAIVIFEVPLLFEAGYDKFFDKTVVVWCNRKTAMHRLNRKGFSSEEALKRLRAQMSISKKKALADFVIDNNHGLPRTEKKVKKIYQAISTDYSSA